MNTAKYTELAPDLTICRAVTGMWQIADIERSGTKVDAEKTAKAMEAYAKAGFTTFDMADHYGSAEEIAGVFQTRYAKGKSQLLTKWVPAPGTITRQQVRDAVERALKRMQSEQIDLMQFHAWSYAHPSWVDALLWLQELKNEGLVRNIGLTNFDSAHLHVVLSSGIEVVSNQVCYSLLDQRAGGRMTEICKQYKVKLLAFGTVAGGFLSEKWLNKPEPVLNDSLTWSQMKYKRFIDTAGGWEAFQSLLRTLNEVAKKFNAGIANIASKYILEQPAVGGIIIGARLGQSEHIAENEKLFSFELDNASKNNITRALAMLKPIPGDCGDEYRKPPYLTASGDLSHHVESFPAPYPGAQGNDGRTKALSGTVWEDLAGFSRAIRKGNRILVSGTTATHGSKAMGGNDPAAQAHFIIDKLEGAIQSLGGTINDVVRTRIFIRNMNDWEPVARAHGERFKDVQPANTMVKAELIGDEYLVEMEAEAMVN